MREQLAQMQRAGPVMRHGGGVVVARQHVVIAIAEYDREIRRRPGFADLDAADVEKVLEVRIRGEVEKELPETLPREDVGNAAARKGAALLLHQLFKRAPGVVVLGTGHEADFAIFGHVPAFGAVAPARGRRTLGVIELLPVVAELGEMRAAGIGRDVEIGERIDLDADRLRHLLQLDPVMMQRGSF